MEKSSAICINAKPKNLAFMAALGVDGGGRMGKMRATTAIARDGASTFFDNSFFCHLRGGRK
jgi:hypothetical protein